MLSKYEFSFFYLLEKHLIYHIFFPYNSNLLTFLKIVLSKTI